MEVISTLINGLSLGSIYALIALGYTMVYGIAKMLNFAHGDIIMVGAYTISITMSLIISPILGLIMAIIVCTLLGVVTEKVAYKPLRGTDPLAVLITAIGISYLLQSLAQLIMGVTPKPINVVNWKPIIIGDLVIKTTSLVTFLVTIVLMLGVNFLVHKTKTGQAMLAVSEDKPAAQLMGINVNKTISITFAIGSGLAAVGALFYLMQTPQCTPTLGAMPGIKAFVAAVIGGIGSIPGAIIGGLLLGIIESLTKLSPTLSNYSDTIVYSIFIVMLLVKPTGIFGKNIQEKV